MKIPKDIQALAEHLISELKLLDDDAKKIRLLENTIYRERTKYAFIAETCDIYEGDRLKNSDPRVTVSKAIMAGRYSV